ncbi:hypothetical protein [Bradyrhizobium brasilense]|uniref:hypothetical protein n=1 Tax=Bradyrhizobium brasilense TaxID=1419277 RepID=UPI001E3D9215|nr:hypothetical protein [Bradyrhizobium brasilense]MCC8968933.1 hypothetical protein [Bradyrhizobium brasilense]
MSNFNEESVLRGFEKQRRTNSDLRDGLGIVCGRLSTIRSVQNSRKPSCAALIKGEPVTIARQDIAAPYF